MKKKFTYLLTLFLLSHFLVAQTPIDPQTGILEEEVLQDEILPVTEEDTARRTLDSLQRLEQAAEWQQWYDKNKDELAISEGIARADCSDDRDALIALYNATNGATCWNTSWDLTQPISTWYGVGVNAAGCVTQLELFNNGLNGTLPAELANLDALVFLNLAGNKISGSLPTWLGSLSSLTNLDLEYNEFTGAIPKELGNLSNLQHLYLYGNNLTGTIPTELGMLGTLRYLNLEYNQLSGSIPASLGNLSNLEGLWMSNNELTGTIPWIGTMSNLRYLSIGGNNFTGGLPSVISNLTTLENLYISSSNLTSLPSWLTTMTWLEGLDLRGNMLGTIPNELSNFVNLEYLNLGSNQLTGTIPTWWNNMPNLYNLNLGFNELTGSIPTQLGALTNMRYLYLYNNELDHCPDFTGSWPNLSRFDVDDNKLSFEDLVYNSEFLNSTYDYQPQSNFGSATTVTSSQGGSHTISFAVDPGVAGNVYTWYRNNTEIATTTTPTYTITNINLNKAGYYYCKVTNPSLSGLTLESSAVMINLTLPTPPNDQCAGAITLPVSTATCSPIAAYNIGATDSNDDTPAPPTVNYSSTFGKNDVWYTFTVPASGIFGIDIKKSIPERYRFWIQFYTGNCGDLTRLTGTAYSSTSYDFSNSYDLAPAGSTIYLRVWFGDVLANVPGIFDLCVYERPCKEPSVGRYQPLSCANPCEYYAQLNLYDLGDATSINISNDAGIATISNITNTGLIQSIGPLSRGSQTVITVEHNQNSACNSSISLYGPSEYTTYASNDEPCTATNLNAHIGSTYNYNQGNYQSTTNICTPSVPIGNCMEEGQWRNAAYGRSIWFNITAPASGSIIMEMTNQARVALWAAADCNDLLGGTSALIYAFDPCYTSPSTHTFPCLNPGQTYYMQVVDAYGDFDITITEGSDCATSGMTCEPNAATTIPTVLKSNYHVTNTIVSDAVINSAHGDVVFTAGQTITLNPNFHAQAGSSFHAYIATCPLSPIVQEETEVIARQLPTLKETELEVYPNPVQNGATIRFYLPEGNSARIMVVDLNGQQVGEEVLGNSQGWNTTELDANQLYGGMYYVILQTEKGRWTKKIMVLKE